MASPPQSSEVDSHPPCRLHGPVIVDTDSGFISNANVGSGNTNVGIPRSTPNSRARRSGSTSCAGLSNLGSLRAETTPRRASVIPSPRRLLEELAWTPPAKAFHVRHKTHTACLNPATLSQLDRGEDKDKCIHEGNATKKNTFSMVSATCGVKDSNPADNIFEIVKPSGTVLNRTESCPPKFAPQVPNKLTVLPGNGISVGNARAIPIRLLTCEGLATLMEKLRGDLCNTAIVFDFDKVLTNVPDESLQQITSVDHIRGGLGTIESLAMLQAAGVPLFIATARSTPALLQDLFTKLRAVGGKHSMLEFFKNEAHNELCGPALIEEVRNEHLCAKIKRVSGTNIFSAGYEKGKLIAHLVAHEIAPERSRVIFVDDNVFHAYFVLQEAPAHIHAQAPHRNCTIMSTWWDPSEEQSRGQMKVVNDSDFSYTQAYQECLSAFGVSEVDRVRTAGILLAKAVLRGET
mmetsp:Transcript_11387/g.22278  ORF Transcript_11387/g.22278 Transcript_11387/m.22278 type:complete len:462 (+) Transcript_11387:424-1809(+)|eukprot:CAMPEP_0171574342 /NCGR_PEP_ID=MMETSP0961-20121227/5299_1 /TAXON_ID=87120 /ORGANISM="Aurantiochytrium limacinum, Strain ATCCMYA-1381" /LENGTH=461 /DNA_ID=CAMNT_0012129637 /DNA_START=356 /DNA_END=1741 /DNA_ORIENTATION=+